MVCMCSALLLMMQQFVEINETAMSKILKKVCYLLLLHVRVFFANVYVVG